MKSPKFQMYPALLITGPLFVKLKLFWLPKQARDGFNWKDGELSTGSNRVILSMQPCEVVAIRVTG